MNYRQLLKRLNGYEWLLYCKTFNIWLLADPFHYFFHWFPVWREKPIPRKNNEIEISSKRKEANGG